MNEEQTKTQDIDGQSRRSLLKRLGLISAGLGLSGTAGYFLRESQASGIVNAQGVILPPLTNDPPHRPGRIFFREDLETLKWDDGTSYHTFWPTDTIGEGATIHGPPFPSFPDGSALKNAPFVAVSPNGPDEYGDFGPRISGTTTAGIQEAIQYAQANNIGLVYIKGGKYVGSSNVTIPLSSSPFVALFADTEAIFSGFNVPIVKLRLGYPQHIRAASGQGAGAESPGYFTDQSEVCLCFDDSNGNTLFAINVSYPGVNTSLAGSIKVNSNLHSTMGGGIRTPTLESVNLNQTSGGTFGYWTPYRSGTRIEITIIMANITSGSISATLDFTDAKNVNSYNFPIAFQSSNGGTTTDISQTGFYTAMVPLWAQGYQNGGITVTVTGTSFSGTYHLRLIGEEA